MVERACFIFQLNFMVIDQSLTGLTGTIILQKSRLLIIGFMLLYLSGFYSVIILQVPLAAKTVLLLLLALVFTIHCRTVCRLSPDAVTGFRLPVNSPLWVLYTRSGAQFVVEFKSCRVFQKIIFLDFRKQGSRIPHRVTIPVDAVSPGVHRKLRKYLLTAHIAS